jgi:nucleoside-diphosphate kinase
MAMERTFVMLKPDAVARGLVGEIVGRIERKGMRIVAMRMFQVDRALAETHYAEHKGKPFFEPLIGYICSGPVVATIVEGNDAIKTVRLLVGATKPAEADPGTIRFDFAMEVGRNLIHASDSLESAARECALFFESGEAVEWRRPDEKWVHEKPH